MGLFDFFRKYFGRRADVPPPTSTPEPEPLRAEEDDAEEQGPSSLYGAIAEILKAHPDGLPDSSMPLPTTDIDTPEENGVQEIRFAPGARDGIATHHYGPQDADDEIGQLIRLIVAHVREPGYKTASMVESYAVERRIVDIVDQVIDRLPKDQLPPADMAKLATYLATQATHPEPVKLGLALLGLIRGPTDDPILRTLGAHDEFALYAGVAVLQRGGSADDIWTMARRVSGWGRVHLVEHLARMPSLPQHIREWLLVDGFQNAVMNEYLALPCADAGHLSESLEAIAMPMQKLLAIAELIDALIAGGGPAPGIESYTDAGDALEHFVRHVGEADPDLALLGSVASVAHVLADPQREWDKIELDSSRRESIVDACEAILERESTHALVRRGLENDNAQIFGLADLVAEALGMDRWPARWQRLRRMPTDAFAIFQASELVNDERLEAFLALLKPRLPADEIATGPTLALGLGPQYERHAMLDYVLQTLRRFPGQGEPYLAMALRSPSLRNRNMAAAVAAEWSSIPDPLRETLGDAMRAEPDPKLRRRMGNVLEGRPIADGEAEQRT